MLNLYSCVLSDDTEEFIKIYELDDTKNFEFQIWYHVLRDETLPERIPLFNIKSINKIYTCYGCENDSPGQRDHMECGGCLHDKCYICKDK